MLNAILRVVNLAKQQTGANEEKNFGLRTLQSTGSSFP